MVPAQLYHDTLFGTMHNVRHCVLPYHPMMPTQLYHDALIGTTTLHYTPPLRLTISSYEVYTVIPQRFIGCVDIEY